jgi:hypothetical protein
MGSFSRFEEINIFHCAKKLEIMTVAENKMDYKYS